jgi:hypothetical protein
VSIALLASVASPACSRPSAPAVEIPPGAPGVAEAVAPQEGAHARAAELAPRCPFDSPPIARQTPLGGQTQGGASRNLMGPYFGGGFGFYPVTGTAPGPRVSSDQGPLEIRLSTVQNERTPEAPIALHMSFANRSDGTVVAVRPLDGTLEGWRWPRYELYARRASDGSVYRFAFVGGRCGNVNPIRADDYVAIQPGEVRGDVVNGWAAYLRDARLPKPGRYTVWVVYAFCDLETRGKPLGPDATRDDVHVGVHTSNAVEIVVR